MVGWTSLSLIPNDEHSVEDLLDWFEANTHHDVAHEERNGVEFLHVYVRGFEAHRCGDDLAGCVLDDTTGLWSHGARIDANNTTDSGDGWALESDGRHVSHYNRENGAECARAHDVAEALQPVVGFRPPVRRV